MAESKIGLDKAIKRMIVAALRKVWLYSPQRKAARKRAQVGRDSWKCEVCAKVLPRSLTAVDHTEPVVAPEAGFIGWDEFIARLFVGADGLKILCKPCHRSKTNKENKTRREKDA